MTQPVWDYKQPSSPDITPADAGFTGQAVVGGIRYRGPDPTLQGVYFFADSVSNQIWTLRPPTGTQPLDVDNVSSTLNRGAANTPVAISEDHNGNLYVTYLSGTVFRIQTNTFTPGDFNGDARVNAADLAVWQANFGTTSAVPTLADSDGDADVDGQDFLNWQQNLGWSAQNVPASGANVPEPATPALLALAATALIARRRYAA